MNTSTAFSQLQDTNVITTKDKTYPVLGALLVLATAVVCYGGLYLLAR